MITLSNFREALISMGFISADNNYYTKEYSKIKDCKMAVNFNSQQLLYPTDLGLIVNDQTTSNFDHDENFVVFECVNRLLDKGYRPEHIELEERWNLGHIAKGGKADITVKNQSGKDTLIIIECKTFGLKYKEALMELNLDGGQLFSYWQQEKSTQWLSLYCSNYENGHIVYQDNIIKCLDDANIEKTELKDNSILLYKKSNTVEDLYETWNTTYGKCLFQNLIFDDETQPYNIGLKPLRKKDLIEFSQQDKIVNKFEEILRHNNVSDKENAFNRLVALFICKLVDEIRKGEYDEMDFQYRMGTDTYESLQDRLQRLHKEGMESFMGEKINYVDDDYAERLFAQHINGERRKAAINDLRNTLKILKYYTNNDFTFKDVHNEDLFYQNGKVLVEVVKLFEKYRIVYPQRQQFLGDLFENLLRKGFKQNEGQYFTPTPIARFIWDCIPLEKIVHTQAGYTIPKIIDYACGAGHFLTEGVEAINAYFHHIHDDRTIAENLWVEHGIYGIEKDYRLARVAKVCLYMNGAGKGRIVFGDGLEQYTDKEITNSTFDILVANPPYSVDGFKSHLQLKNNSFELLNRIAETSNEIQTLFVERISQLLKPKGIAAVILPDGVLNNKTSASIGAREILLKNFLIRAIVELSSNTFGTTPQTTRILFLEKYNEPPQMLEIAKDPVRNIFSGNDLKDWQDEQILKNYTERINVEYNKYLAFSKKEITLEELYNIDYFNEQIEVIKSTTEYNRCNTKALKLNDNISQNKLILDFIYDKLFNIEKEKLYYFTLAHNQKTLIITHPSDSKEDKNFLGYTWSTTKGKEGIHIFQPGGQLYNESNRFDNNTIAAVVRKTFKGCDINNESNNTLYKYTTLTDLIDFDSPTFEKKINTVQSKKIDIISDYKLITLGQITNIGAGGSAPQGDKYYKDGIYPLFRTADVGAVHLSKNLITCKDKLNLTGTKGLRLVKKGTILIPKSGASTFLDHRVIMGVDGYVVSHLATIEVKRPDEIMVEYIYSILTILKARSMKADSGYPSLNTADIAKVKVPIPDKLIQSNVVTKCNEVDKEFEQSRMTPEQYQDKIKKILKDMRIIINDLE